MAMVLIGVDDKLLAKIAELAAARKARRKFGQKFVPVFSKKQRDELAEMAARDKNVTRANERAAQIRDEQKKAWEESRGKGLRCSRMAIVEEIVAHGFESFLKYENERVAALDVKAEEKKPEPLGPEIEAFLARGKARREGQAGTALGAGAQGQPTRAKKARKKPKRTEETRAAG